MTARSTIRPGLLLAAAALLTACGGSPAATSTTSTTQSTQVSSPTGEVTTAAAGTSPGTTTASAAPTASTTPGSGTTTAPQPSGTAATSSATSSGTKADAGISPAARATVDQAEFCRSLKTARFAPEDLTQLRTTTVRETTEEVVDRMERLADVMPPADLEPDWRAVVESFDAIASKAEESGQDAAVPGIVRAGLASAARPREAVLQAAAACP